MIHVDPNVPETHERSRYLIQSYKESDIYSRLRNEEMVINNVPIVVSKKDKKKNQDYARNSWDQTKILFKRNITDIVREPLK